MHGAEAVAEPRRARLREHEVGQSILRDVAEALCNGMIENRSLQRCEVDVPVNGVGDAAAFTKRGHALSASDELFAEVVHTLDLGSHMGRDVANGIGLNLDALNLFVR